MPIDAATQSHVIGRHQARRLSYEPDTVARKKLRRTAASQTRKLPRRPHPIAGLLVTGLILPNICLVGSSSYQYRNMAVLARRDYVNPGINAALSSALCVQSAFSCLPVDALAHALTAPKNQIHTDSGVSTALSTRTDIAVEPSTPDPTLSATTSRLPTPMPAPQTQHANLSGIAWDDHVHMLYVNDADAKQELLKRLAVFLSTTGQIDETQARQLSREWQHESQNTSVCIAPALPFSTETIPPRGKRISTKNREDQISAHVEMNCAFETEILNPEGLSEGKLLIFKAQRAENPFRMLYEGKESKDVTALERHFAQGLNFVADVLTMGFKPMIGQLVAAYYRRKYFESIGDDICTTRQIHLTFAILATSQDIEGLAFPGTSKGAPKIRPPELKRAIPLKDRTTFYTRNKQTWVMDELLLTATDNHATAQTEKKIYLRPKGETEFETYFPDSAGNLQVGKRIIYDDPNQVWRYADTSRNNPLEVGIEAGETFITLQGERYPLRMNSRMEYQIIARQPNGKTEYLPVYREFFSNAWHLNTYNNHPVFPPPHQQLIENMRVAPDATKKYMMVDNENPQRYGTGKIIEVRHKKDDINSRPLYTVVEMRGELVVVQKVRDANGDIRYDANSLYHPEEKGRPVVWNGARWMFDRTTSPHVSRAMREAVTTSMYAPETITINMPSPDLRGIHWLRQDEGYIKVKRHFVRIYTGTVTYMIDANGRKIVLHYRNHQFHLESLQQRLNRAPSIDLTDRQDEFYTFLRKQSSGKAPHRLMRTHIIYATQNLYPSEQVQVEDTPSSGLKTKRFMVAIGTHRYFLETGLDGSNIRMLLGTEHDKALEKFNRRVRGGAIEHVLSMQLEHYPIVSRMRLPSEVRQHTRHQIIAGSIQIRYVLDKLATYGRKERTLLLGNDAFFSIHRYAKNAFATPSAAYQALVDFFVPLSESFPDAIIAPGSIYISASIPERFMLKGYQFKQNGQLDAIENTVNFSTVIAPVFFNGKIVTIARKGNYLSHRMPGQPESESEILRDLALDLPRDQVLDVQNYHEDEIIERVDTLEGKIGSLFTGKTLFAGEHALIRNILLPHMANNHNDSLSEYDVFNSEFVIGDEKFLYIIGDEFFNNDKFAPAIRSAVLPRQNEPENFVAYDWVLHVSTGHQLDQVMRNSASNYLRADTIGKANQFVSTVAPRRLTKKYPRKLQVALFDYTRPGTPRYTTAPTTTSAVPSSTTDSAHPYVIHPAATIIPDTGHAIGFGVRR